MKKFSCRCYILLIAALACGLVTYAAIASPAELPGSNPGRLVARLVSLYSTPKPDDS